MRIRSPKDFWSGLFFIAVAAGFIGLSHRYGTGTMHRMGPGLFPILVSVLLAGLGLIIAAPRLRHRWSTGAALSCAPHHRQPRCIALFGAALAHSA